MDLRKLHNLSKKDFIQEVTKDGNVVLDVGCGCGGDFLKWGHNNVVVIACDPNERSVCEAKIRRAKVKIPIDVYLGDISCTPVNQYDIICYNFSLQYTFASSELFKQTIKCIKDRSKIGTTLMGIVPDSDFIMMLPNHTVDSFGNEIHKEELFGEFGESVNFYVPNTPYYKNGPLPEPVAWKDLLVTYLCKIGFELTLWTPLISYTTGTVSDVYSKFIFTRIK